MCKRWNRLMESFFRKLTTLHIHCHEIRNNRLKMGERKLLKIATRCPNVRRLNLSFLDLEISSDAADYLAQLWPLVEELDLGFSRFSSQVFGRFGNHFPRLKSLIVGNNNEIEVEDFDILLSNHPNLSKFEFDFVPSPAKSPQNFIRSLCSPLQTFDMFSVEKGKETLNVLEKYCKTSLEKIKISFLIEKEEAQLIHRIFSTFYRLRHVSFSISNISVLQNLPVLSRLERFYLFKCGKCEADELSNFFQFYPQLKKLYITAILSNDHAAQNICKLLSNLQTLVIIKFDLSISGLMKFVTLKKLKHFTIGVSSRLTVKDLRLFVFKMPSLQRFMIMNSKNVAPPHVFDKFQNEICSSGLSLRLTVA